MCDYIVAYVRSDNAAPLTAGQVSSGTRPVFNVGNSISVRILRAGAVAKCRDGRYLAGRYAARSLGFELLDTLRIVNGVVQDDVRVSGPWRMNQEVLDRSMFVTRQFGLRRIMLPDELDQARLLNDLLDDKECYNEKGSEELNALLADGVFDNPKPRGLLDYLTKAASVRDDDVVVDFFAGSGTTGHAVMAQNLADAGDRRFILVQLPERLDPEVDDQKAAADFCDSIGRPRTIAELTKERLRRAGQAIRGDNPDTARDTGFRVFKLDSTNIRAWDPDRQHLKQTLEDAVDHLNADRSERTFSSSCFSSSV